MGAFKHIGADDQETLKIELISDEAVKTSESEGEILNRDSVQSSLRYQLGLDTEKPGIDPAERSISEMMADLYRNFSTKLDDASLFAWHKMLLAGDRTIKVIGSYRTHTDPMQVVSCPDYKRTVHFEAPPSSRMDDEMAGFITRFNDTALAARRRCRRSRARESRICISCAFTHSRTAMAASDARSQKSRSRKISISRA